MDKLELQSRIARVQKAKYPTKKIRPDITLEDVAEVVLMQAQELTDLKGEISQLKAEIQRLKQR